MQFANHEGVQRPAGDRTAQAVCTLLVGNKGQALILTGFGGHLEIVAIDGDAVRHIRRAELQSHPVARVDPNDSRVIFEAAGINFDVAVGRRGRNRRHGRYQDKQHQD